MDPNANLSEQLELANQIIANHNYENEDAVQLATLVQELHTWLIKGGALPIVWKK